MKVGDLVTFKDNRMAGELALCVSYDYHKHGVNTKIWRVKLLGHRPCRPRYLEEELELISESR